MLAGILLSFGDSQSRLEHITESAFQNSGINKRPLLPNRLQIIGYKEFLDSQVKARNTSIIIPESVREMGTTLFSLNSNPKQPLGGLNRTANPFKEIKLPKEAHSQYEQIGGNIRNPRSNSSDKLHGPQRKATITINLALPDYFVGVNANSIKLRLNCLSSLRCSLFGACAMRSSGVASTVASTRPVSESK